MNSGFEVNLTACFKRKTLELCGWIEENDEE
jgi:hypothetical protein